MKPRTAIEKVKHAVLAVKPAVPASSIHPETRLVADLGIDSLKFAELGLALEDAFGRPMYLGDILAEVADPSAITVADLAAQLEREE